MKTYVLVAHLSLYLSFRSEGSHRVNHNYIDSTGVDKLLGNIESLLAVIGLGYP